MSPPEQLNEFRVEEASYCELAEILGRTIGTALAGQRIDMDASLQKPKGD